jgi:hypothetical protein
VISYVLAQAVTADLAGCHDQIEMLELSLRLLRLNQLCQINFTLAIGRLLSV